MAELTMMSCDNPTVYKWTKQFVEGLREVVTITGKHPVAISTVLSGVNKFIECFNPEFARANWPTIIDQTPEYRQLLLEGYLKAGEFRFPIKRGMTEAQLNEIYRQLVKLYPATFDQNYVHVSDE